MNKLNSFDKNKKKCFGCKEYFEKSSVLKDAVRIGEVGLGREYLCVNCLKESRVDVRKFINKHLNSLNQSDSDEFVTFMEKYCEIQKKLIEDFKNEQT
jgi:hypothetical protein